MPFIKVHINSLEAPGNKALLVEKLREIMVEKLNIDEKIGQVVLYEALPQYRAIHIEREKSFVFIEVLLYPGRTAEMKENLMRGLVDTVHNILRVDKKDINCCLLELAQENWYGGISHRL